MSESSPTYLVTGGAGFIGSNLVAALAERQARIVVCDYDDDAGRRRNLAKRELADWVTPPNLFAYLHGRGNAIDGVFHLGAVSSTVTSDWELVVHQNYGVSLRLWDWCVGKEIPLIYASSAATYGGGEAGFDDDGSAEGLAKLTPLNPYGWSKHIFDRKVAEMTGNGEPAPRQWAGLKFFNVYGPNEYHKGGQRSVVPQIYERIAASNARGGTCIVIEQDTERAMRVAGAVSVLLEGRVVLEGDPEELGRDRVSAAYFGIDSEGQGG